MHDPVGGDVWLEVRGDLEVRQRSETADVS
jgi:hypothetical protein